MRYDGLAASYWSEQGQRIEQLRKKINAQSLVTVGRMIPDDESLVIGSGRRLNLAVLFVDICDSSARASYIEAEQLTNLRVFNLFFSEVVKIAEKNTGDGLLAYFEDGGGDPPETASKTMAVLWRKTLAMVCSHTSRMVEEIRPKQGPLGPSPPPLRCWLLTSTTSAPSCRTPGSRSSSFECRLTTARLRSVALAPLGVSTPPWR